MGVFDSEFLTLLITTFIITRIDPVVDFVKFVSFYLFHLIFQLLKGLTIYLPPDNKYSSEVVKPIPKDCKDKDEYMNKEIQEVPHVFIYSLVNCRKSMRYQNQANVILQHIIIESKFYIQFLISIDSCYMTIFGH